MAVAGPSSSKATPRRVPISILPPSSPGSDPISLVWSPNDVLYLRSQHRIMGILTGSLPLLPQQNAYLGVPLQLMPEEVQLLLSRDAVVLVDDEEAHAMGPSREEWQRWSGEREKERREERRQSAIQAREHRIAFEEALKKGKGAKAAKQDAAEAGGSTPAVAEPTEEELRLIAYSHITAGASDDLPWYSGPNKAAHDRLVSLYFSPSSHTTRSLVFSSLNSPPYNYFLSCGLRFGGDFVAYPGDPFRYHSHYTLTVPKDRNEGIAAGKLIADGRLGTAVKKVHVLATKDERGEGIDEGEGKPIFFSLTWAGFGT
ncbi:hypothetical protein BDZ90DRAFT_246221 [Jaminaea rosea]|uniref:tRNA-splicing endonuclease subunit Sen34 n=1 Tax=Jaminaea rosea TaxID=1569628 RepID=A0A316USS4_9BASI|nr:hypothetical protein BDZ90DRAFT_246221 [Jaminaea rosea]PWN27838.1 hypothetical protein BDZ90DRAFT_246221 [Jaminaea rosea]